MKDTWILPKQLHTLACALDTAALSLGSNEQSQICAQSLFVRSKPSPSQIWLRKWKRDSWTQHLSGRILRPSLGERFVTAWTSSLGDILASPSAQPASAKESKTRGISGRGLQMVFDFSDPGSASLRTSKDISAWGCPTSSKTWQEWVIGRRGAYSARLKSAHRTSASGCSSWPTAAARDHKGESGSGRQSRKGYPADTLPNAMAQWPSPVASEVRQGFQDRSRGMKGSQESLTTVVVKQHGPAVPANWPTPNCMDVLPPKSQEALNRARTVGGCSNLREWVHHKGTFQFHGQAVPASSSTDGSRPGLSATPRANKTEGYSSPEFRPTLHQQAQSWATPSNHDGTAGTKVNSSFKSLVGDVEKITPLTQGKLNPRWVDTLMGLPVGWTMPSCASPVTIERMSSDCSVTVLSQPPQNGPSDS